MKPKPKAPPDLWAQMDALRETVLRHIEPPPGSFTVSDYAQRYKVCESTAKVQIMRLCHSGKLRMAGRIGKRAFYAPVEQ